MLEQNSQLIKRLREIEAIAKLRAKEIVQKEEILDAQRLSDQAVSEFDHCGPFYLNVLNSKIEKYRHKRSLKDQTLLRLFHLSQPILAVSSAVQPRLESLSVSHEEADLLQLLQSPLPNAVSEKTSEIEVPLEVLDSDLPDEVKECAIQRAKRNSRSAALLDLDKVKRKCQKEFPNHVKGYLALYEHVFKEAQTGVSKETVIKRLAHKRGRDLAKKVEAIDETKLLASAAMEFGEYRDLYCDAYRSGFENAKRNREPTVNHPSTKKCR